MRELKDNIYEILTSINPTVARQWRQDYQPVVAFPSAAQEMQSAVNYFFNAFSRLPGNFTHELNCITGNAHCVNNWLIDFRNVVGPSFVRSAPFIFAPRQNIADTVSELGSLLGAY